MIILEFAASDFAFKENYEAGFGEPYEAYAYGAWNLKGEEIPIGLAAVLGGDVQDVVIRLNALMRMDDELWQENRPFAIGLSILVNGEAKVHAERELSLGHVLTQRDKDTVAVRMPLLDGLSFRSFCAELFAEALADVLRRAKATVRWDEQGVVVTVNVGNTFISTREHTLVDAEDSAFASSEYIRIAG